MFYKAVKEMKRLVSIILFMTNEKIAINKFRSFCKFLKELNVSLTDNELYSIKLCLSLKF